MQCCSKVQAVCWESEKFRYRPTAPPPQKRKKTPNPILGDFIAQTQWVPLHFWRKQIPLYFGDKCASEGFFPQFCFGKTRSCITVEPSVPRTQYYIATALHRALWVCLKPVRLLLFGRGPTLPRATEVTGWIWTAKLSWGIHPALASTMIPMWSGTFERKIHIWLLPTTLENLKGKSPRELHGMLLNSLVITERNHIIES